MIWGTPIFGNTHLAQNAECIRMRGIFWIYPPHAGCEHLVTTRKDDITFLGNRESRTKPTHLWLKSWVGGRSKGWKKLWCLVNWFLPRKFHCQNCWDMIVLPSPMYVYPREIQPGHYKWWFGRGDSFKIWWFWVSMLNFKGVIYLSYHLFQPKQLSHPSPRPSNFLAIQRDCKNLLQKFISGWWFQPIWKILVKLEIFPK